ncbi:MAG: N-acetyltransferase, partial [Proteobacteria bacterium]|nr:N-acetyltransferase [Pseudomonadota bacterium]
MRIAEKRTNDYVIRVLASPLEVPAPDWNALLAAQPEATPFMRHEYLAALHESGSATPRTGWTPRFFTLWRGTRLAAACALYLKDHSWGEYVFDWAWADAYTRFGLPYYPKALVASPFTPVPGARLLAEDAAARRALVRALIAWCREQELSSLHLLFGSADDLAACADAGMMLRHQVQFHWHNRLAGAAPHASPYADFDDFLASLNHDKRKKIRQERRKVAEAGVVFRWSQGRDIAARDWDFFYRCYERTYLEHGNAPYLRRDFFHRIAATLPEHWVLFVAERAGRPIATSLIAINECLEPAAAPFDSNSSRPPAPKAPERVAYGRYWGALERVDCLHFEACYYQPLAWCIAHGIARFEGGAQGEHKMARALLPTRTSSAHWLAHPAFADAVERFLAREGQGVDEYLDELAER